MNIFRNTPFKASHLWKLALVTSLALPMPATTATLTLATAPLTSATTTQVLPNLMFILDDSGSMDNDFVPDSAGNTPLNMVLFKNPAFNGMYYSPGIRYVPPAFFDAGGLNTTAYPSQIGTALTTGADTAFAMPNWRKVKRDAYGIQTSSSLLANGTIDNLQGTATHYTFVAGEYCLAIDLKVCIASAAPSGLYIFPAPLRWCNSAANAIAVTPVAGSCQAVQVGSFTNGRYPVQSKATINVTGASGNLQVTGITVSGQQIMSGAISGNATTTTIANSIATAINNCTLTLTGSCTTVGFSATVSGGSIVTIYAPARTTVTPVMAVTPSTQSRTTLNITGASSTPQVNGITVSTKQIMSVASSGGTNTTTTIAQEIVSAINACTVVVTGNCTVAGYSASRSGSIVTIVAPTSTIACAGGVLQTRR